MLTVFIVFFLGEPTAVALTEGEAIRLVKENNPGTSVYRELPFYVPDDIELRMIAGPIPKEYLKQKY